ncbi:MAG TPA: LysM peptidoglycan-binding domain-containing protein [Candidatus Paceibacterota bacterium]
MVTKTVGAASLAIAVVIFSLGFIASSYNNARNDFERKEVVVTKPAPAVEPGESEVTSSFCEEFVTYTVPPKGSRINSLWRVTEEMYKGRGYMYRLIAEDNNIKSPYVIQPGQVLRIRMSLCNLTEIPKVQKVVRPKSPPRARVTYHHHPSHPKEKEKVRTIVPPPAPEPAPVAETPVVVVPAPEAVPPTPTTAPAPPVPSPRRTEEGVILPEPRLDPVPRIDLGRTLPQEVEVKLPLLTPGSAWNSFGTNPVESHNWTNQFHVDQGAILGRPLGLSLEPYVAVNATQDTGGFSWNNKVKVEGGLKVVKPFPHGVMNVSLAYASEHRENETRSGPSLSHDGWFGWDQPTRKGEVDFSVKPGSVWWIVGNVSPFEKNNVIGLARAEQGITIAKAKGVSFIPLGWAQAGFDTQDKPWNNRYTVGGGLKMSIPWNTRVVGLQGGYECTRNYDKSITTASTCGPTVKADFWTGWRKLGGK